MLPMNLLVNQGLFPIANFIAYLIIGFLFSTCHEEDGLAYNPCKIPTQLELLHPAAPSRAWLPYQTGNELVFMTRDSQILKFMVSKSFVPGRVYDAFYVICPQDSTQLKQVNYAAETWTTQFQNTNPMHSLISMDFQISTLLDKKTSRLDKIQLADIMEVSITTSNFPPSKNISFVIFDRGYNDPSEVNHLWADTLWLNSQWYQEVYYSVEKDGGPILYFKDYQPFAIQYKNKLYLATR